jgi:hypothetical protein
LGTGRAINGICHNGSVIVIRKKRDKIEMKRCFFWKKSFFSNRGQEIIPYLIYSLSTGEQMDDQGYRGYIEGRPVRETGKV